MIKRIAFIVLSLLVRQSLCYALTGEDMWVQEERNEGLFTPHINFCDSTEVFVAIATGSSRGFCIEKDERAAAAYKDARQTCVAAGKRLVEPVEWEYACENPPAGLIHMTDNWEWTGNSPSYDIGGGAANNVLYGVLMGNGGCNITEATSIATAGGSEDSRNFRCAR
jgi:hypothetical protein